MTEEDYDEEDEYERYWAPPPYADGKLRLMAEKCSTCIFRSGNLMDLNPGRVAGMLADIRRDDSYIPCHKTLGTGLPTAICRGGNDAHVSQLMQIAERLGVVLEVTEAEVLAEIERRPRV